jgi:hypothetical protein
MTPRLPNILLAHEEQGIAQLLTEDPRQAFRKRLPLPDVGRQVAVVTVLHQDVDELLVPAEVHHVYDEFVLQGFQSTGKREMLFSKRMKITQAVRRYSGMVRTDSKISRPLNGEHKIGTYSNLSNEKLTQLQQS